MLKIFVFSLIVFSFILYPDSTRAGDFSFSFEWGDIKSCTTGRPNRVPNPIFSLENVPAGTAVIKFQMKDLNAPNYNHGGGSVEYSGGNTIQPGVFKYKSPCPPGRVHTYRWKAIARDENGEKLAIATSKRDYPEQ
tara:strand:- start:252 stop:659 length:408 start_codon:yes stop_codon:yes gene_type:complete